MYDLCSAIKNAAQSSLICIKISVKSSLNVDDDDIRHLLCGANAKKGKKKGKKKRRRKKGEKRKKRLQNYTGPE